MKLSFLDKTSAPFLKLTLNAYSTRHKAIAKNVSNVETEGYRQGTHRFYPQSFVERWWCCLWTLTPGFFL